MAVLLLSSLTAIALIAPTLVQASYVSTIDRHRSRALPQGWTSQGCVVENAGASTLTDATFTDPENMTIESCINFCAAKDFAFAGVKSSQNCFCGNDLINRVVDALPSECNNACTGDRTEICGGDNHLSLYWGGVEFPSIPQAALKVNSVTRTLPRPPSPVVRRAAAATPVTGGLPAPWQYNACWVDNAQGRIFPTELPDNNAVTVESCIQSCRSQGFTLAGLEFAVQCFCGNTLINGAVLGAEADCNMGCGGNPAEACGGPNRLSVYTSTGPPSALPVPVIQTTGLPANWQYQSCILEGNGVRVFPYENQWDNNNTVTACINQCALFGYPAAGVEFGSQCFCGDPSDVTHNSPGIAPQTDCSVACSGDPIHLCGGGNRLSYYTFQGSLDVWHTPGNTGGYQFLIGGLVVPLIATVGINGKVSFLEKWGTSEFSNSTGAYELDLSLINDFTRAWRTMHVKSDVFCSGSVILPDKAARVLNVGGWSLDSTFGVRLYAPDGSPGVNGTNDWEENFQELKLQRGRWYPSSLVLSNGSVLVMGGEVGSNGAPEPSLEILPTPAGGPTFMNLDFLQRTDPNNLYPFLHVLPSGNIFVGYYNEARILDPRTFQTIKTLPNMPGSANSFLPGRTYPMEGTSVFLPQHAPYSDPIQLLVCGGSTPDGGIALDNCVSITPEAANPQWTIERMPSKRVMSCISALPDGTYLIVNGAMQGVAGFGLASDPNFSALLYDPTQPIHQRISILGNTIVARLYHSEATLLPDGRVLISGSDPQTPGFPEETRIEVYIPPYLSSGLAQPSYTITQTDWAYGGTYSITVTLHQGTTANMRVSLIAATSSTHGNVMGGRTIFPAFTCSGNTCTITAPPNANISPPGWHQLFILDGPTPSHSTFVRIGGDPARLGNWPNFPDFKLPGV